MKNFFVFSIFHLVFFQSMVSLGQQTCASVFSNTVSTEAKSARLEKRVLPKQSTLGAVRLEMDLRARDIKSESDPRFKETLLDTLSMMTETLFVTGDKKAILEKGELRLAREYGEGQSIEFEYIGDKRGAEMVYRLNKIYFIKGNGKDVVIDKQPLADDGFTLMANSFIVQTKESDGSKKVSILEKSDIEAWAEKAPEAQEALNKAKKNSNLVEGLKEAAEKLSVKDAEVIEMMTSAERVVKVPTVISGPVLKQILKWSELLPFLTRLDLRNAIEKKSTTGILAKARMKYHVDYAYDKVIKKQAFKAAIIGSLFFAYTQYNKKMMQEQAGYPSSTLLSDMMIAQSTYTKENIAEFEKMISGLLREQPHLLIQFGQNVLSRVIEKKSAKETASATEDVQRSISDLIAKEESHAGSPKIYIGDRNLRWTTYVEKNFNPALSHAAYMVGVFEKQSKIAVVSIFKSEATSKIEMAEVLIDRMAQPELYEKLRISVKNLAKTRK